MTAFLINEYCFHCINPIYMDQAVKKPLCIKQNKRKQKHHNFGVWICPLF